MTQIQVTVSEDKAKLQQRLVAELQKELRRNLLKAGRVVVNRAKQLVPQPGYPGDKPSLKPLRDTIGAEYKELDNAKVILVGPKRPAGSHGHLVEGPTPVRHHSHGEATGEMLEQTKFLEPAAKETEPEQRRLVRAALNTADRRANEQKRG